MKSSGHVFDSSTNYLRVVGNGIPDMLHSTASSTSSLSVVKVGTLHNYRISGEASPSKYRDQALKGHDGIRQVGIDV